MLRKPEKFVVTLTVSMIVAGVSEPEAKDTGRDWLQQTLNRASADEVGATIVLQPIVAETSRRTPRDETVHSLSRHEDENAAAAAIARKDSDYIELCRQLEAAQTTEEHLRIGEAIRDWKMQSSPHYSLSLVQAGYLLDTLAEAVRWSETHPDGPRVWNIGGLYASLRRLAKEESDAIRLIQAAG